MSSVLLYCPDRHLTYTGSTPESSGVGGGVTARIHLARALARRGHEVTVVANCPAEEVVDGARFLPLDAVQRLSADLVVLNSSGGALSLAPAADLRIDAGRLLLWLHGVSPIAALDRFRFDRVVVPSRFIAATVGGIWRLAAPVEVIPNGFHRYPVEAGIERDPFRLAYTSHPAKGLGAALTVLDLLRRTDPRYTLHLYGGAALWGQSSEPVAAAGVTDHGLVPQPLLQAGLHEAGFALHLQAIPEAFSISVSEAMASGAIPVVSPVGALAERIDDGRTGIVVAGDHTSPLTAAEAARRITRLAADPVSADEIRRRAAAEVLDWDDVARMWEERLLARPAAAGNR